jgi:hypothetical protein
MPRVTCAPNNVQQKRTKEENVRKGTMTTHLQNIQHMRVDDDATLFVKVSWRSTDTRKRRINADLHEDPREHNDLSWCDDARKYCCELLSMGHSGSG